ncbi:hypothetical protein QZH41_000551 [Actinostola sp. cb2023]|nr:hypothetical protein QZH41_000551 [Actinostola sp. cb2023]
MEKTRTTPLRPQSDGMVARFNRTLKNMPAKFVDENLHDWDRHLPMLMMAYRSAVHETTGCSPSERGIELFNSWDLQEDDQKKLKYYWEGFESAVKPHSNELMATWELYNLNQEYHIEVDPNVSPIQHTPRKVPVHLQ